MEVPGEYSEDSRPPASEWIPPPAAVVDRICPQATDLPEVGLREHSAAFVELGRTFRFNVALGAEAGPDVEAEVLRVIDALEIQG